MNPKILPVSAIIPVADRPHLLLTALESIQLGTNLPSEILIIFNGDTQDDQNAVENWLKKKSLQKGQRCLSITETKKGVSFARNTGIKNAHNDFVAFLDSDDLWVPQKLQKQWEFLQKRPYLFACHTAELWIKSGHVVNQPLRLRPRTGRFFIPSLFHCLVSASSLLLHKKIFQDIGFFDEQMIVCEDFDLWLRILLSYSIGLIDQPLTIKQSGDWSQLTKTHHSIDSWRIKSILQIIQSNNLPHEQLEIAYLSCMEKIKILEQGALAHNKAAHFDNLRKQIFKTFAHPYPPVKENA